VSTTPGGDLPSEYRIASTVVKSQPNESAFPLTKDKYDLLKQGITTDERQSRDLMFGIFLGTLVGVISLAASLDLHKSASLAYLFVPAVILLVSAIICGIMTFKMRNAAQKPGCSRVRDEIDSHFR
jgi:hypothetical protein